MWLTLQRRDLQSRIRRLPCLRFFWSVVFPWDLERMLRQGSGESFWRWIHRSWFPSPHFWKLRRIRRLEKRSNLGNFYARGAWNSEDLQLENFWEIPRKSKETHQKSAKFWKISPLWLLGRQSWRGGVVLCPRQAVAAPNVPHDIAAARRRRRVARDDILFGALQLSSALSRFEFILL